MMVILNYLSCNLYIFIFLELVCFVPLFPWLGHDSLFLCVPYDLVLRPVHLKKTANSLSLYGLALH